MNNKEYQPLISIIIPMYNASSYIEETINRILQSTYNKFELIIVDDGSTDDSLPLVQSLSKKDNRIKIVTQENKGAGAARNHGIQEAKGEYIRFIDSDDFMTKDSLSRMLKVILENEVDFVMGAMHFWWNKDKHRSPYPHEKIYKNTLQILNPKNKIELAENASCTNKLYKKSFLINNSIDFPQGLIAEDIVFTFNTYLIADKIAILPENEIVYYWRVREGSVSRSGHSDKYISDRIEITNLMDMAILSKNLKKCPLSERIRKRNINSILDIMKLSIDNFNEKHYTAYKMQLLNLKASGFNIYFNPSNVMKQIIFIILNYSYINGIDKIKILLVGKKDLEGTIELNKNLNDVVDIIAIGQNITLPTNEKNYYSTWTNTDSLFFKMKNLKKGKYILYIEYAWNSKKTKNNFRSGILAGKNIFNVVSFPRTKSWKSFSSLEIIVNIYEDTDVLDLNLRTVNEIGIGFINLKSIKYVQIESEK